MNEGRNRQEVIQNIEKDEEDVTRMITRTVRLNMNEEAVPGKKIKTCNEEALALKIEKGNKLYFLQHNSF